MRWFVIELVALATCREQEQEAPVPVGDAFSAGGYAIVRLLDMIQAVSWTSNMS